MKKNNIIYSIVGLAFGLVIAITSYCLDAEAEVICLGIALTVVSTASLIWSIVRKDEVTEHMNTMASLYEQKVHELESIQGDLMIAQANYAMKVTELDTANKQLVVAKAEVAKLKKEAKKAVKQTAEVEQKVIEPDVDFTAEKPKRTRKKATTGLEE